MSLTREEYETEKALAEELDFVLDDFAVTPYEEAATLCNGIGAEWMPPVIRKALSKLHPSLKPVADNHDMNFSHADGSNFMFKQSNEAFKINGYKVAKHKYGVFNPLRYWVMYKARQYMLILNKFGGVAYKQACKGNNK